MSEESQSLSEYERAARELETRRNWLLCTPALIVLLLAASGPLFVMLFYSFLEGGDYGGVVSVMPWFAAFMVFFAMANAGLPGTSGFVGEFMVILASFRADFWFAFLAATTLIVGAAYTLWMVKRVVYGEVGSDKVAALEDINKREALVLTSLAVAVLVLGVWPAPLIEVMDASIANLVQHIAVTKL